MSSIVDIVASIGKLIVGLAEPFLIIACIFLLFDLYLLLNIKAKGNGDSKYVFYPFTVATALIIASYLTLTFAFISDSFWLKEVYMYSSSSLPVIYKLAGPWISSRGSLLFIASILALIHVIYRGICGGRSAEPYMATYGILNFLVVFFILITLFESPFETLNAAPPEGRGLNPLLQTPWVVFHPIVIFLGYAFVFFSFALMLGNVLAGKSMEKERQRPLRLSIYSAWLFLALGIALGGKWSYEVLGWGGYWSWDPVETASIFPWLAITATFHVPFQGKGLAREFMLMVAAVMVSFAMAITRGGFMESVHAFGQSPMGSAFLGLAIVIALVFFLTSIKTGTPIYLIDINKLSPTPQYLFIAYGSIILLLAVCFLGTIAPALGGLLFSAPMALKRDFYNAWCYPFTLALIVASIGYNARVKIVGFVLIIASALGIGLLLVFLVTPTSSSQANFALPFLVISLAAIVDNFTKSLLMKNASVQLLGRTLLHLSIVLILIGVAISSSAIVENKGLLFKPDSNMEIAGAQLKPEGFIGHIGMGSVYYPSQSFVGPECSALEMDVKVQLDGSHYEGPLWIYYYTAYGTVSKPWIISAPMRDLYLSMHFVSSNYSSFFSALQGDQDSRECFVIIVKSIPMIWLIWAGAIIMVTGIMVIILGEIIGPKSRE